MPINAEFWKRAEFLRNQHPLRCEQCAAANGEITGKGLKRPKRAHVRVVLRGSEPVASELATLCERCWPSKSREKYAFSEIDAALQLQLF